MLISVTALHLITASPEINALLLFLQLPLIQTPEGFLMFSEGRERVHWERWVKT